MYIQDLRNDFYNFLVGKRLVIISEISVDSIGASKILQFLFLSNQIVFTFVPVLGRKSLKRTFEDNKNDCNIFLFVNCGGKFDLVDFLQPEDNVLFFICDSHRPLDLCNIYSLSQVS